MATNYMNLIGQYYPTAQASCLGSPTIYANISWVTAQIAQAELDAIGLTDYMIKLITEFGDNATNEIIDGFISEALGFPHWYDSEQEDQINLIGAVATQSTMPYSCRAGKNACQVVDVGGAKTGTDATGFTNDATTYDAEIVVNGSSTFVSVEGSTVQTYDNLLTQIQADLDLGANGSTITIIDGNLSITSALYADNSTIDIIDTSLFNSLTGYVALDTAIIGNTASSSTPKEYKIHTNAELLTVINDGKDVKLTILQKFNVKKAQVLACTTEAEIDVITW